MTCRRAHAGQARARDNPGLLACCLAVCAAALTLQTPAAFAAEQPPCVGAGVLAIVTPPATVPQAVGPAVSAFDRQALSTDAFSDTQPGGSGLTLAHADVGAAGCVDPAGTPGGTATRVSDWSVLGGAVGARKLSADLVPHDGDGTGWRLRVSLEGLQIGGLAVELGIGDELQAGNWGILSTQATFDAGVGQPLRWWRSALELRLTKAHAGYPTGTVFLIGWVSADRRPAAPPLPPATPAAPTTTAIATTTAPAVTTPTVTSAPKHTATPAAKPARKVAKKPSRPTHRARRSHAYRPSGQPLRVTPPLGPGVYDFPVYGSGVSWGDTYGAGRSDVSGGWHHGDDLFAALGTPIVAVADGTVFAVGWNRVGGWRLWLRDRRGNAFYYAHFSGYTALAKDAHQVRRGDVLGFVGNTGDAFTTVPHLHFEVHPNELLYLGYNGAVNPTGYLAAWVHPKSVRVLPPVVLPQHAPSGEGAVTDFRRLLALRPLALATSPRHAPAAPRGNTGVAAPLFSRTAAGPVASPRAGDGWAATAAAAILLALAALAVGLTVRQSRSG